MLIFPVLLRRLLYGKNHKLGPSGLRQMIFAIRYARKTVKICQTSASAGFFPRYSMPVFFLLFLQEFFYTFKAYLKRLCYLVLFVALFIQTEYTPVGFYSARFSQPYSTRFAAFLSICYHHIYRFAHIIILRLFHVFFQFLQFPGL